MAKPQKKTIITCAVTGAIHTPTMSDGLPYTADDIAGQAIAAAEAGALAGGVDPGQAGGLPGVDGDGALLDAATQGLAQLQVGHQAEAAGQALAGDFAQLPADVQAHCFQAPVAEGLDHMAAGPVTAMEQAE